MHLHKSSTILNTFFCLIESFPLRLQATKPKRALPLVA